MRRIRTYDEADTEDEEAEDKAEVNGGGGGPGYHRGGCGGRGTCVG